jgi:hypothetical protein
LIKRHQKYLSVLAEGSNPADSYVGQVTSSRSDEARPSLSHSRTVKSPKLTMQRASMLLSQFHRMSPSFPFISVPQNITVQKMSVERPFLLLAILTVASMSDFGLHCMLNERFRMVLSAKVVIQGEKSLDYLQGLVVYLAWYVKHINCISFYLTIINLQVSDVPWTSKPSNTSI